VSTRRALVCAPLMPEYDRECGSRRVFDLIEFLRESGWAVSFVARQAQGAERYARLLRQRGVATYAGFDHSTELMIGAGNFDLAVLGFWEVAEALTPVIRRVSPGTRVLVDSVDLHFLRSARGVFSRAAGAGAVGALDQRYASEMARELNAYAAADGVLAVSRKEADLVNDLTADPGLAAVVPLAEGESPPGPGFAERRGILFVGNFRHAPNVGAVEFLCREVVPRIEPDLLAAHPVRVVGNALNDTVRGYGRDLPHVRMVGWVPSVRPYLERARVAVVPLRYGAGTKGKLVEAVMAGTPAVSTRVGVEGLALRDEEHLLVADDPAAFAGAVTRLLTDEALWERLSRQGRAHLAGLNRRGAVREQFLQAVATVLARDIKPAPPPPPAPSGQAKADPYDEVVARVRQAVRDKVPAGSTVLVVSKGDEKLIQLDGRKGQHFPQAEGGVYAGCYPAEGPEAVAHLEALRAKGCGFLAFPSTSFWWLDHYKEFREHLDAGYPRVWADRHCIIYQLSGRRPRVPASPAAPAVPAANGELIEKRRPAVPERHLRRAGAAGETSPKAVLVLGIYLADQWNNADDIVATLSATETHRVTQRWVGLGGGPPTERVGAVTVRTVLERVPKFELMNELLGREDLSLYDYVVLADDDVILPRRFLDCFITLQARLDFRIAQPARTGNSYIDLPIVGQQRGVLARQTLFVEIGPVVSFHRSCYDLVFPFDLTSPMGWGYENVWSFLLAGRGLKMGIIDAVPVDHSLRKSVTNYAWSEADGQRKALLSKHEHFSYDECFRVLATVADAEGV
jgi:glycosyltransferase involved in cell wall biosynthesis